MKWEIVTSGVLLTFLFQLQSFWRLAAYIPACGSVKHPYFLIISPFLLKIVQYTHPETAVPPVTPWCVHCAFLSDVLNSEENVYEAEWEEVDRTELESNHIIYSLFDLKQAP